MIKGVYIEPECFTALITSAIEVYNRETNGFLLGDVTTRKVRGKSLRVLSLHTAQPFQLEERKPTSVLHTNKKAIERLIGSLNIMEKNLVGGYHSHPFPHNLTTLSSGDVDFIREEMVQLRKHGFQINQWLELVMAVKGRNYMKRHKEGRKFYVGKSDVGIMIKNSPYQGFKIRMRAHALVIDGKNLRRKTLKTYIPLRDRL